MAHTERREPEPRCTAGSRQQPSGPVPRPCFNSFLKGSQRGQSGSLEEEQHTWSSHSLSRDRAQKQSREMNYETVQFTPVVCGPNRLCFSCGEKNHQPPSLFIYDLSLQEQLINHLQALTRIDKSLRTTLFVHIGLCICFLSF